MKELVELFNKEHVEFAVCGGFAVAHYGFIRATMDFDLLVLPHKENAVRILKALEQFGFGGAGIEISSFLQEGTVITLGAQPNQIDLLTSMCSKKTDEIIKNSKQMEIKGILMSVVSFEDLLFAKSESLRGKDRIDFEELKKIHSDDL
ncbi:MAG: nucleotidyltransferase [Deltaproteobacteria bacterium]|nr:nucleotidyltransferase [Deltaproteobacteria bacterium]